MPVPQNKISSKKGCQQLNICIFVKGKLASKLLKYVKMHGENHRKKLAKI